MLNSCNAIINLIYTDLKELARDICTTKKSRSDEEDLGDKQRVNFKI